MCNGEESLCKIVGKSEKNFFNLRKVDWVFLCGFFGKSRRALGGGISEESGSSSDDGCQKDGRIGKARRRSV